MMVGPKEGTIPEPEDGTRPGPRDGILGGGEEDAPERVPI
jgi:hypothetical protein